MTETGIVELCVLNSEPGDGSVQMAHDRGIVREVNEDPSRAVLRWYTWAPPTFSIGRGQKPEDLFDARLLRAGGIPWVERPTGGAMVYHGRDLSYSLTLPRENPWTIDSSRELYRFVTEAWIEGLKEFGIDAHPPERQKVPSRQEVPSERRNLCLAYHSPGDLLIDGKKFGGSAQRRAGKVWHQQGFFLLRPLAPPDCFKDPSVVSLMAEHGTNLQSCGYEIDSDALRNPLTEALRRRCLERLQ